MLNGRWTAVVCFLLVAFSVGACTLSTQPQQPTSAPLDVPTDNPPILPTLTPLSNAATQQPTSSTNNGQPGVPTACIPRTDLQSYTVKSGDTLNGIAERNSTTISVIMSVNCLTDANVISVGQVLRLPDPAGIPVTNASMITIGAVSVSPVVRTDSGALVLTPGQSVTLSWTPATGLAGRIKFYVAPTGTGITPILIGTDENATDGGNIQWVVPNSLLGYVSAEGVAVLSDAVWARTAQDLFVMADATSGGGTTTTTQNITLLTPSGGSTITGTSLQITGTAVGLFESTFTLELRASPSGTLIISIPITYSTTDPSIVASWSAMLNTGGYNGDVEIRAIYTRPSDGVQQVMGSVPLTLKNP